MNTTPEYFTACSKVILLSTALIFSGCASITLNTWNEEFEEDHQRTIEFVTSSVSADYLGKIEGEYVYKSLDTKKQAVIFRLPVKSDGHVKIANDESEYTALPGKTAMFHFNDHEQTRDGESDFPQDTHVFTSDKMTRFR